MKGLLVKDLSLMKINAKSIVFIFAMAIGWSFLSSDGVGPTFATMITFIFANMAMNLIAYDDMDNGMEYIMTLPISRNIYVVEKYVLTILATVIGGICSFAVGKIFYKGTAMEEMSLAMGLMMLLMASITMPIYIKYGIEKGRTYVLSAYGIIIVVGYFLLGKAKSIIALGELLSKIEGNEIILIAIIIFVMLIIYTISMFISCRILNKKEF